MAVWTFQQRGSRTGGNKRLQLDNYNAPFGRARKGAVIKEEVSVSVQSTAYPGYSGPPTRHVFGSGWQPTDIHGRWMTHQTSPRVEASQIADTWIQFVRDELPLTISWGNIAQWEGFIQKLTLEREDEHNIAWSMAILLDGRTDLTFNPVSTPVTQISNKIEDLLQTIIFPLTETTVNLNISPDIFTQLDGYAGILKGYTATLVDFANLADSIERQTFSTIQSFRGILSNIETALAGIQIVCANGVNDSVLLVRRTESDLNYYRDIIRADNAVTKALAIIADIIRTLDASTVGNPGKFVTAQDSDTWETLSTRATGGPNRAGAIRETNGIKYGQLPVAGDTYLVQ